MTLYDDIYPFYPLQRTAFSFDTSLLIVTLVFLVLVFSVLLILPGIRGKSRLIWMLRIIISLFIGAVIVALNFTADWAEATLRADATYKSFSVAMVKAEVGLHVGLHGINVTLRGTPVQQLNETIDYNERFLWSGEIDEEYADAMERGLPHPILYIAEKFTLSSPCGLIYQYRYSARYASANLWAAFCCWLVANILFSMPVLLYAGYMTFATATFIFVSMASFSTIYNLPQCNFNIGAQTFTIDYSHSFWLALATGLLCALIGITVVVLDCLIPEKMREVFSIEMDCDEDNGYFEEGYHNSHFLEGLPLDRVSARAEASEAVSITSSAEIS